MEQIQMIDSSPKIGGESKKIDLTFGKKFITRSLRSSNYDLETALSELVDNSIDAESKNIKISFPKKSEFKIDSSIITIIDDGDGMTENELINSMTLGSDREYQESEIGFFGIGMKASLAYLSEKVIIKTKKKGDSFYSIIEWDIDKDTSFNVKREETKNIKESGTSTFIYPGWRYEHYSHTQESVVRKKFGARYFHVLYTDESNIKEYSKQVRILINNEVVLPQDPMYRNDENCDKYEIEPIQFRDDFIKITGYFLKRIIGRNLYDTKSGNKDGFSSEQQGIYVLYNSKYINLGGTLLGAVKGHPDFNNLRIELEIPKGSTEYFGISMNKNSLVDFLGDNSKKDSISEFIKKSISEMTSWCRRETEKYKKGANIKDPEQLDIIEKLSKKINNEFKSKGITKNPLSNPEISEKVPSSPKGEKEKKDKNGQKDRPSDLKYEKNLFDIVPYSGGESNEFWELNRRDKKIIIRLNVDHLFYKQFVASSSDGERDKIIKLLYSLSWAQLETLGNYHFDGAINDLWSDFWNTASRALKRTLS